MARSSAIEGLQFAHAGPAGNLTNSDLAITELDTSAFGSPSYVGLLILTGDVAPTAVLDVFSLHGANAGGITPGSDNLLVSHEAVASHATNNDDKAFFITFDNLQAGHTHFDAIVSNNTIASWTIQSALWVMSDSPIVPSNNNFGSGSPKNG